jgi:hypothetical protein
MDKREQWSWWGREMCEGSSKPVEESPLGLTGGFLSLKVSLQTEAHVLRKICESRPYNEHAGPVTSQPRAAGSEWDWLDRALRLVAPRLGLARSLLSASDQSCCPITRTAL